MNKSVADSKDAGREQTPLIYLVDDEPFLLEYAEQTLAQEECRIQKFPAAEAALARFTAEDKKPELLVTDYALGANMTGLDLAAQCRKLHPALRVILVSGTLNWEEAQRAPVKVDHFIAKPYKPAELIAAVKALLGPDYLQEKKSAG
jgi:DNA-binding NtrC family response regulator